MWVIVRQVHGVAEANRRIEVALAEGHTELDLSGLNLESYAALMRGGKGGAVIVPGQSGASRLVGMIEGRLSPKMPPAGSGLSAGHRVRPQAKYATE